MNRQRLILAGAVVLALAGSFAAGRYTRAVQTRDVVRVDTQWKTRTIEKVVHDVAVQRDTDEKVHTVVVTKWLKSPTGDVSVVQESHQERDTSTETKRQAHTQGTQERQSEAHQETVETRTVTGPPNWSISALVGAQLSGNTVLLPAPLVCGVHIQRRVLGPVSVGIWGTTEMSGGVSLGASW